MLRECERVLRRGRRLAGYVIHIVPGGTKAQAGRAAELGSSEITATASFETLTQAVGLTVVYSKDVTAAFHATCAALANARSTLEDELRLEEGDEFLERNDEKSMRCCRDSVRAFCTGLSWWLKNSV